MTVNFNNLSKIILVIILSFLLFCLLSISILHFNRDAIHKRLFTYINSSIEGQLEFTDIEINPFAQFPNVSLTFKDLNLTYKNQSETDTSVQDILRVKKAHMALDLIQLIDRNIYIQKLKFEDGQCDLRKYNDGSLNISKALEVKSEYNNSPEANQSNDIQLLLNQISLNKLTIIYNNQPENKIIDFTIESSKLDLNYINDSVDTQITTIVKVNSELNDLPFNLTQENILLNVSAGLNLNSNELSLRQGTIKIKGVDIDWQGKIKVNENLVDVDFSSRNNLGLARQLFTSEGVQNIENGFLYLNGHIYGKLNFPKIDIQFGADNLTVRIPQSDEVIDDLNLHGKFESGNEDNFGKAILTIDTLYGLLPHGYVNASFSYENFIKPKLNYIIELESTLEGIDKIVAVGQISNLKGRIQLKDQFIGERKNNKWIDRTGGQLKTKLDNVSFTFRGNHFVIAKGEISGSIDSIALNNFDIKKDNSSLTFRGRLLNIRDLFFDLGNEIDADLMVESKGLRVKDFYTTLDTSFREYDRINDLFLDVRLKTNYHQINQYQPKFNVSLNRISAALPNINSKFNFTGAKLVSYFIPEINDYGYRLFNGKLEIDSSLAYVDINYQKTIKRSDSLNVNLDLINLNLASFDKKQMLLTGDLAGKFIIQAVIPLDSLVKLEALKISADSVKCNYGTEAIAFNYLEINAQNLIYLEEKELFQTLKGQIDIKVEHLESPWLNKKALAYNIRADQGEYTITPSNSSIYGQKGRGSYKLSPFKDPPTYQLAYVANDFPIIELMSGFDHNNRIEGNASLELNIQTNGKTTAQILQQMEGKINLTGTNISFYGLDLDRIIRRYERTQKFSLLDYTALALTGPIGLAVTKGSNYVNMANLVRESDSTIIEKLNSEWSIKNGKAIIDDVAFSTHENRVAAKGWIGYASDSIELEVGAIDNNGCIILSQRIQGLQKKPSVSGVKIVPTIMAPVTKLFKGILNKDCVPFYDGKISHPVENEEVNSRKRSK